MVAYSNIKQRTLLKPAMFPTRTVAVRSLRPLFDKACLVGCINISQQYNHISNAMVYFC